MKERTNHNLSKTPYIDKYTTDLTEKIRPKRQDFVAWGRQDEIRQVFISLNRLEKKFILFIDEVHTIMGTGVEGSALDVANSLKPALSRGEIYLISATTADEFMIIERDPAMERRLQPVYVDELDKEASILVLKKRRPKYKRELDIEIPTDAIKGNQRLP